jgi:hypothetical protein
MMIAITAVVAGAYTGTWGPTTLEQDGAHVSGAYAYDDGRIAGTLDGDTLRFSWTEDAGAGRGVFEVMPDGTLRGTWGTGDSDSNGGAWELDPASARRWERGFRFPWDVTFTPGNISMGAFGVGLDEGRHLGRGYLGVSAEWELEVNMSAAGLDAPSGWSRLRGGVEARHYLGDGLAAVTVNDEPAGFATTHEWIGARGGVESYDLLSHAGAFAEAELGWDADLGGTELGMLFTAGASREPKAAFGVREDGAYVSPYVALGIHLVM